MNAGTRTAAELANRVESLRDPQVLGASVTVPHKIAVMGMLDEVSPAARRAGAVNTIVNRGGALFGDNTDIYGFGVTVSDALGGRTPQVAIVLGRGRRRARGRPRVGSRGSRRDRRRQPRCRTSGAARADLASRAGAPDAAR